MHKLILFFKKFKIEILIFIFAFIFSSWLMFATFSYQEGNMVIASKAWSDFASHIPLIRSFSFGNNFPPQYPLFSGSPIRYHFLFYAFVGILERTGLRIDYALNIPSALGFSFLILMIYLFAKEIFKSRAIGILSIILFLFNGSLSFIKFFTQHQVSKNIFIDIIQNNKFTSFGPYDNSIISAFWNLNIYTNQRHLAFSYAISLLLIYIILKFKENEKFKNLKKSLFIGIFLGLLFIFNMAVFLMTLVIFSLIFLFFNKNRLYILISLILGCVIALPLYIYTQSGESTFKFALHFGYLVTNLNMNNFINYWFKNLGLYLILIPLAFVYATKKLRKILISFFSLFLIGNLFQFSPEIAANHKFFNYFMIIGSMFSAYILFLLWKKIILRPLVMLLFFLLIMSGIIDFFPIYNDSKITLPDYPVNKDVRWIMQNTKPSSVFLNSNYLYDNASLAGRKIFLGWPYFAWSQGYDTNSRDNLRKELLTTNDLNFFCNSIHLNNINYVGVNLSSDTPINIKFFENNFKILYKNSVSSYYVYDINKTCK